MSKCIVPPRCKLMQPTSKTFKATLCHQRLRKYLHMQVELVKQSSIYCLFSECVHYKYWIISAYTGNEMGDAVAVQDYSHEFFLSDHSTKVILVLYWALIITWNIYNQLYKYVLVWSHQLSTARTYHVHYLVTKNLSIHWTNFLGGKLAML